MECRTILRDRLHDNKVETSHGDNPVAKKVLQPLALKGAPQEPGKLRENRGAVGGMRNPAHSIQMVGGHGATGDLVANIVEDFLDANLGLEKLIVSPSGPFKVKFPHQILDSLINVDG